MHDLLVVLKVIGIIILSLIILVLGLLAIVLFVPIRYFARVEFDEKTEYAAKVWWLAGIISFKKDMYDEKFDLYVFGIKLNNIKGIFKRKSDANELKETENPEDLEGLEISDDLNEGTKDEDFDSIFETEEYDMGEKEAEDKEAENNETENDGAAKNRKSGGKRKRKKKTRKKKNKEDKEKKRFSFDKISGIISFVRDDYNKKGFRKIKDELVALIKYILPYYIKAYVRFGTGDPCSTGQVIGAISLFPIVYGDDVKIIPDFEEKILKGNVEVKGRLRVIYLVRLVVRCYLDDEIMNVIKKGRNLL